MTEPSPAFTKNVAIALASLISVAGIGWIVANTLNSKADASLVENLSEKVNTLQTDTAVEQTNEKDITRRLNNIEMQLNAVSRALNVPIITKQ